MNHRCWSWLLPAALACQPPISTPQPVGDPCRHGDAARATLDTVNIGFSEALNEGGRVLLRLTGRTLVRLDCTGRLRPGLARGWSRDATGTTWTFELDPATSAPSLVEQWEMRRNGGIWPWSRILEVRADSPHRLLVRLDTAFREVPPAFALPPLAVAPEPSGSLLPARVWIHPEGIDQRDLLDLPPSGSGRGADLLVSRDPALIRYAGSRPQFAVIPLAWDRTYVALAPVSPLEVGKGSEEALRESLAREVVRADSRAAQPPFWWDGTDCIRTRPLRPMGRQPLVAYLQGDESAREIAERMVALASIPLTVAPLAPETFTASLAGGEAALYIFTLPRTFPGSCGRIPAWPSGSAVVPLVDVRAHAVVRSGVPPFTTNDDGTFQFDLPVTLVPLPGPMR